MANANLNSAKAAKADEYYTVWADIEREMNAYLEYDQDVFRGKTILLPCDDPEWSNFTKFFALHFTDFGLKKLISTSYAPNSNAGAAFYTPTLFETEQPGYDPAKSLERGRVFTLTAEDVSGDGRIDIEDLRWEYLEGDGDFRSAEVTALRDEADFVITNPPFSLFRAFMAWLMAGEARFSIVGNSNATTYVEVFPLIQSNRVWKGATANMTDMVFAVPKGTPVKEADKLKAARMGYPATDEYDYTRLGNSCWFTSIEHGRRHEELTMLSEEENIKFSRHTEIRGQGYERYYNFPEAIEVPFVDAIPADYPGIMGVPITFLDRYNPEQFEILAHGDDMEGLRLLGVDTLGKDFVETYYAQGGTGGNSPGHRRLGLTKPKFHTAYKRIMIRHRTPVVRKES